MHSGGSMTGGSIQQKAQNLLGREREMKELAARIEEINGRVTDAGNRIEAWENQRSEAKKKGETALYDVHQQEIAVVRDTERLRSVQADVAAHAQRMDAYRAAVEQLDESLGQIAQELERLSLQTSEDETGTDELNARTEELAILLDKARRERENAQELLTDAMLTLQNAQHDVDRIRRDKERLSADIDRCREEIPVLKEQEPGHQVACFLYD
jgi:chromosome segregation protein